MCSPLEKRGCPGGGNDEKPLPVGVDNFEKMMTEGYCYIDKTMMIKELLDLKGEVNLFTVPDVLEKR